MPGDLRQRLQATLGNQYSLEQELGGGGMSRVFVAEEVALGRRVVVKVLTPDLAAGVSVERFRREILLVARLQHPLIVPVLTSGEVDGLPYYIMPLVKGESLRARITRSGELPISEVVRIMRDITAALSHAHSEGVIHRDIKPDNVILSGGVAVVTDLGVGKAVDVAATNPSSHTRGAGLTSIGVAVGTPAYMAPEQAAADPSVDHRADIYALGCIGYEMLAGTPPFSGRSVQQTLAAHLAETPEPIERRRDSTPPALAQLITRCLAKHPADRPQSATEVMNALELVGSTGSTTAASVPATPLVSHLPRALAWYFAATVAVIALSYVATTVIGLPSWVPLGAIIVMALGFPAVMATGWAHGKAGHAAQYPTLTPGGTEVAPVALNSMAARVRPHLSWRRTTLGGVAAVGAFALVVVAYMSSRALGIGPWASLAAAGVVDRNQKVLIADFESRGNDASLAMLAAEAVRTDLGQSDALVPVSESEIAAILRVMQQPDTARLSLALARSVAQREGLRAIVTGDITPLPEGSGMVIAIKLVAAQTGDQLAAFRETIASPAEMIGAIGRLSKSLRAKAGESLKSVRATPALERVTTPSLEALREYVEASRANANREYTTAIQHARLAVAADSNFASAWRLLGTVLWNADMPRAAIDSALTKSYQLRDRLTEVERYRAVSTYFQTGPGRSREQAARVFEDWLRKDTASFLGVGSNNYAILLNSRRQFKRAEEIIRMTADAGLDDGIHQDKMVVALFNQGKIEEAEAWVEQSKKRFPEMPLNNTWEIAFLYSRGQLDSLEQRLNELARVQTGNARSGALTALRNMKLLRGQLRESYRIRDAVTELRAQRGLQETPWTEPMLMAANEAWFLDQPERAVQRLDSVNSAHPLAAAPPGTRPYYNMARAYAMAGRPDRAREILLEANRMITDTVTLRTSAPGRHNAEAEIEFAEGRPLEAIRLWGQADTLLDGPSGGAAIWLYASLARGFAAAGQPDSAIYWHEKYVSTPYMSRHNADLDPFYLAASYKKLGELYEEKGDRAKAREYYQKFVTLWDKADPELQPVVQSVKARIAKLSGEPPPPRR